MANETIPVSITDLRESDTALRPAVKESESYQGIVSSIREKGFMGAITARRQKDQDGNDYYEIIDGAQRFNAARDCGLATIPVTVVEMTKTDVLEAQVMMNLHKVETKPAEFAAQLKRLFVLNPTTTVAEQAARMGVSPAWIMNRLNLNKLTENIQTLVDDGKIVISNAFTLAKLPEEEQAAFVDQAVSTTPSEFTAAVSKRAKELAEARRQGRAPKALEFEPVAVLRKKSEVEALLADTSKVAPLLGDISSPLDAAVFILKWAVRLDEAAIAEAKAAYEKRKADKEAEKAKLKAEKEAKKQAEAAKAAAAVSE